MVLCSNGSCFKYSDVFFNSFIYEAYSKIARQFAVNSTSKLQSLIFLVLNIISD
ncbi:Uncharacterised protein [Yersinia pekkanenii]|uniref:Uncharacterized protein n=1 Tax=Yersinia pekkanenii TaxID=1288385 RepID=A0A0T9PLL3_9GAMM|nr:Uncharacterised protein [Yersinia pekkanenii]CRY68192.1 Uncharacterised protein [Yersinia pekkanenii]